jgi:eukaryotic-like serine/threonine-protein kinase
MAHPSQPPTSCPPADLLRDYLCGRIADQELELVAAHLKVCPDCLGQIEQLDRTGPRLLRRDNVAAIALPADPAFEQAVRQLLTPVGFHADRRADPLLPGDRLGEYRLLGQIGEGGMGTTYKALHARLEKVVALKVLRPLLAHDPASLARFRREMRAIGRLRDPNIVQATDAGEARGCLYLVMEHLTGETLSQRVRWGGPLPVVEACRVIRNAARGLRHAHDQGLVHRDVKPSNIMLTSDGQVKLLDLGLALLRLPPPPGGGTADPPDVTGLSEDRGVIGTNDYMAPEQWRNSSQVDARADQYSLGCTLYYALTGRPPFAGDNEKSQFDKMQAHLLVPPPAASRLRPEVPPELDAVIARLLAKSASDRFASMNDAIDALGPFAGSVDASATPAAPVPRPPNRARRIWLAIPVALAAALLAVALKPILNPVVPPTPPVRPPVTVTKTLPGSARLPLSAEEAKALQARWADYLGRPAIERNATGLDMVLIPPGEYEPERISPVVLTQPFDLGRTEVTYRQFQQFVSETGYKTTAETGGDGHVWSKEENRFVLQRGLSWKAPATHDPTPDHPVVLVSWDDANKFCDWLTGKEKRKHRLPTEWEWQWACRAGSDQKYFFGSDLAKIDRYAWQSNGGAPRPVGQLLPNAWGLLDMLGNVHEWALNYSTTLPGERKLDPRGEPKGRARTVCGGGFDTNSPGCQHRIYLTANVRWNKVGFRVLREIQVAGDLESD